MKIEKYGYLCMILLACICAMLGCRRKEEILFADVETDLHTQMTDKEPETFEMQSEAGIAPKQRLLVHICGAVNTPGVYEFDENDRIYQAVEKAGGFTHEADTEYLNMAEALADGMKIYIPTTEETIEMKSGEKVLENADGRIDLNTAGVSELCTLPGIGEAKAKSIIEHREKVGRYTSIEEIMDVEGIKEGLFNKIKDSIKVS